MRSLAGSVVGCLGGLWLCGVVGLLCRWLVGWLVVMALWFCDRLAIAGKGRLAVKMPGWVNDCLIHRVLNWLYN